MLEGRGSRPCRNAVHVEAERRARVTGHKIAGGHQRSLEHHGMSVKIDSIAALISMNQNRGSPRTVIPGNERGCFREHRLKHS